MTSHLTRTTMTHCGESLATRTSMTARS